VDINYFYDEVASMTFNMEHLPDPYLTDGHYLMPDILTKNCAEMLFMLFCSYAEIFQ
jgi:hypothetical protein